ncbi:hypothetical protein DJ568_02135 [Mucilaginibacter hurinus]|uniref:Helix-hairpin-helix domain-containing protein n=1 Tax=Mucilaginibacter hurinus TaxID=2201324 RepID=A0A367GTI0_9SPHI|nr:helix-hairpin-helix domain-containing protein [Mucilaginibacter hurinus]RCH56679.1 hypothetical protein DJ568_02135 [Mucilaginibacter hurinus]
MASYLKSYLAVTKKEWNGLVVLMILVMLILSTAHIKLCFNGRAPLSSKVVSTAMAALNPVSSKRTYSFASNNYKKRDKVLFSKKARLVIPVELNRADSAALTTVYGIGPSFARRIIRYRELLGGYANKEQLKEVYGLDANKYAEIAGQIRVDAAHLKKVNVNTADMAALKEVPYLTYKQMNAIEQYRIQHGNYTSANDLLNIAILDGTIINKIKPYIVFK